MLHWFYPPEAEERRTGGGYVRGRQAFTDPTAATAAYEAQRARAEARGGPAGAVTLERFEVRLLARMELLVAALATASTFDDATATDAELRASFAPEGGWWTARQRVKSWRAKSAAREGG